MNDSYWARVRWEERMEKQQRTCDKCGTVADQSKDLTHWSIWKNAESRHIKLCDKCCSGFNPADLFKEEA